MEESEFWAALRIIFLIAEYYKEILKESIAITKEIYPFILSLSMLKKLTAMNKYPTAHLKYTMNSEWDILQVIHRLMTAMKEQPELDWVQSHQNNNPDIDKATLSV